MTEKELLTKIKTALGITGEYQDEALQFYIDEVKSFMRSAGVPQSVVDSSESVGVIMRGVADLWTYQSGGAKLSEHFILRVNQLSATPKDTGGEANA